MYITCGGYHLRVVYHIEGRIHDIFTFNDSIKSMENGGIINFTMEVYKRGIGICHVDQ